MRSLPILLGLLVLPAASSLAFEDIEHPIYKNWARFKVGTSVTTTATTVGSSQTIETKTTTKLVELTPEKVVLERVVVSNATGTKVENPPQSLEYARKFFLLPGVKKADLGKPQGAVAEGEQTVKVAGKEYKAKWYDTKGRTEAGETLIRSWMSDEVPGMLLKAETRVVGKLKTTMEVTEIKTP